MSEDLYRRYRPLSLDGIVGQPTAVATLRGFLSEGLPHAILISGPTGSGKTTLAGILVNELGCDVGDLEKVNAAEARGIDNIREIKDKVQVYPAFGSCRMWVFDECHRLTSDAQSSLLDVVENLPKHSYFIFTTTDSDKLLPALRRGRMSHIALQPVPEESLRSLLLHVVAKEGVKVSPQIIQEIAEGADGSAREALTLLEMILSLKSEKEQRAALSVQESKRRVEFLGRLLVSQQGVSWGEVSAALKELEGKSIDLVEDTRRGVLAYATKTLLRQPPSARAAAVIHKFEISMVDGGLASMAKACYELLGLGRKDK